MAAWSSSSGATSFSHGTIFSGAKSIAKVIVNEEEGVPEAPRFNAGQKLVFWAMAFLVPALFFSGLLIWGGLFLKLYDHRAATPSDADP